MRILFVAPLPPPVHGQSLASEVFLNEIKKKHELVILNMSKRKDNSPLSPVRRTFQIALILMKILKEKQKADIIYLTISESISGNLKDLLIYFLCFKKLDKMIIHLHGGAGMKKIMGNRAVLLARINSIFFRRLKGIIVLGESHRPIFEATIAHNKIHVIPNFAEDYLFITLEKIKPKFKIKDKIKVLFLSNLILGKGHIELLNAYISLSDDLKSRVVLDFAGAFSSKGFETKFLDRIRNFGNVHYHGVVRGGEKKSLFHSAQVFCLPTYYPYEGQPISILEAYASGCVVITTDHSGIRDVFQDKINGYEVKVKSSNSLKRVIEHISNQPHELYDIGLNNRKVAEEKYRTSIYNASLKKAVELGCV